MNNTSGPPKPPKRSPYFKRLADKVQHINASPEEIQQLQDIHRATDRPRYPDPTGVSGKAAKWPITDTLVNMLGEKAPSISGVPFFQGDWAPAGMYLGNAAGLYNRPREGIPSSHISINPGIIDNPRGSANDPQETLVHEFGHALEAQIQDSSWGLHRQLTDPYYSQPTKDEYSKGDANEQFAQTFRNGLRFIRARDTTGLGASDDSLPGTTRMYDYLKKAYFPK